MKTEVTEKTLIVSPTWLGDCLMAMPAVQGLKEKIPGTNITILSKKGMVGLWQLNDSIDDVVTMPLATGEMFRLACELRGRHFVRAYILPNSFRSALIPFVAKIPERIGMPGHFRGMMLTEIRKPGTGLHQSQEYGELTGTVNLLSRTARISASNEATKKMNDLLLSDGQKPIALMPGAAFGAEKRWAPENYIEVARELSRSGYRFVLLGSSSERDICARIAEAISNNCLNLAGETSIDELTAALSCSRLVLANDSGGAHLAAAIGATVLVIFGVTDPGKTAPLGKFVKVVQSDSILKGRDMVKHRKIAQAGLQSISPSHVLEQALMLLDKSS
jgi:heptosyltransferase-2